MMLNYDGKIASGGERLKADEWGNLMQVYPVTLAVAWQMWTRQPDENAPAPHKCTKVHTKVSLNRKSCCTSVASKMCCALYCNMDFCFLIHLTPRGNSCIQFHVRSITIMGCNELPPNAELSLRQPCAWVYQYIRSSICVVGVSIWASHWCPRKG